ncbi:MAG TPA: GerMN domain-containing protein [Thermoanaerobaculia bacterium]|nr:GerMN domain-containing protein [Thermoanaerobaculia bacterium]
MSRRAAGLVLGAALLLLAGGLAWWWFEGRGRRLGGVLAPAMGPVGPQATFAADLYFPADDSLRIERRNLTATDDPKDRIKKIVQALLAGPTAAGLARPLPPGVELGAVALTADGTAYLDLRWAEHEEPPPGGSDAEMQTVYSLVDTVVANVPQIQRVALLWNGTQRETFSGHLDTSQPLVPDRKLH